MYDTVIIGSGAAGLSAAVYAMRAQLNAVVVEKNYMGIGQIGDSERVDNYLGLYGENGFDLGQKFREHAVSLGTKFINSDVLKLVSKENVWNVILKDDKILETRTVIYAAGANPRKLEIKGEAEFTGRGVSYCAVCDGAFYRNKTVAVVGGGDTALQDALLLSKTAEKVYLIHRRDEFRANKTLQENVKSKDNIILKLNAVPIEIAGDKKVNSVNINCNGVKETLEIDGIFIAVGTIPNSALLSDVAELDSRNYVVSNEDGITSAKGIFVAGDVRTKKLRQVVTAVSDGANCVYSVESYLERNGS